VLRDYRLFINGSAHHLCRSAVDDGIPSKAVESPITVNFSTFGKIRLNNGECGLMPGFVYFHFTGFSR
jgi:hypothetical protein